MNKTTKLLGAVGAAIASAPAAFAQETTTGPMAQIIDSFDISSVIAFVGTAGVAVVGVAFGFKGVALVKRMLGRA